MWSGLVAAAKSVAVNEAYGPACLLTHRYLGRNQGSNARQCDKPSKGIKWTVSSKVKNGVGGRQVWECQVGSNFKHSGQRDLTKQLALKERLAGGDGTMTQVPEG